ncbi:YceI family protein [Phenylobacterium montanum]|uniref:Polyisoprenoid-binding protein n=1 Tax=Phenylobacterium montanum TaxID=2823693 RepID=A0A975FZK1_9CAUL|nr:YceI family protein [Caulobacter sp. S6]QUD88039.1 polyisoprenoid-binding protein [Caulobacter sp. S6]
MRNFTAVAAALAVCALAPAHASAQASSDPSKVQAGTYAVEPFHTRVLFAVNHMGFTTYYGNFTGVSGSLQLDPAKLDASQVSVSIPVASVSTTNTVLDGELKSPAWLNAAADPTITFKSTKVVVTGPNTADITGDLTLHGVTKPVVLAAKFNASGANPMSHKTTVGFDATAHLNRSDFGVKTYVPVIGDQVDVIISAAFEKAN